MPAVSPSSERDQGLIQNSTAEVESGVRLVRDTGEALKTIGGYINNINTQMEAIATSSREQSTGLSEVNVAVNQMDQTTQQNAAMVEQTTAAAAALSQEAGKLLGTGVTVSARSWYERSIRSTANTCAAGEWLKCCSLNKALEFLTDRKQNADSYILSAFFISGAKAAW